MVVVLAAVVLLPVLRGDERGTLFDTGAATIIDDDDAGGEGLLHKADFDSFLS